MAGTFKNLRICVCTWNVGNSEPLTDEECERFLQVKQDDKIDVYAIGLQEIKTGARETVNSFINYDDWAKRLSDFLSKRDYYMVENVRVQGISLSLFTKMQHLPFVRFVRTEIERTGIAGAWGNKGGVAVSCWMYGQHVCFLNVHLSAHLDNENERIKDVKEIFNEMDFGGKSTVLSHDLVLMFGDMNFRVDEYTRDFIIESVGKKNYSVLWERDQLKKNLKVDDILSQFEESDPKFDPSYKFDPGSDTYDTSSKKRKPAWTDRVLWRIHPEVKKCGAEPPFTLEVVDSSFHSIPSFKQSDHKPVTCQFSLKIRTPTPHEPLLLIKPTGAWTRSKDGEFTIEFFEGMEWNSKDYVGLYPEKLKDFRTYETYVYVPSVEDSSSSSSSDDDDVGKTSKDFKRKLAVGDGKTVRSLKFKKSQIKDTGTYRLGYYSTNTSCLAAVSPTFEII